MEPGTRQLRNLVAIKLLHTLVWVLVVACILAIPLAAIKHQFHWVWILSGIVLAECIVIGANRFRCPLTDLAGRYTTERAANFDIYLPPWLARKNKMIFGTLFVAVEAFSLWWWFISPR